MTKIIDFKEKEKYSIPLLIKSCTKGTTQKGSPYLNLVLQDSSGSIDAKLWDVKTTDEEAAVVGNVVNVNCEVLLYNHALQLRVNNLAVHSPGLTCDRAWFNVFILASRLSI